MQFRYFNNPPNNLRKTFDQACMDLLNAPASHLPDRLDRIRIYVDHHKTEFAWNNTIAAVDFLVKNARAFYSQIDVAAFEGHYFLLSITK